METGAAADDGVVDQAWWTRRGGRGVVDDNWPEQALSEAHTSAPRMPLTREGRSVDTVASLPDV